MPAMMEVPAVWTVSPGADPEKLDDILSRLGERLDIDKPEVKGNYVMLPADYPKVARALDEVEPDWKDEGLLTPPEP